ncbi:histidine--tRNA ligase [Methylocapsa sp. S129]|uniref:histidine--tRNA ligase n=1 Tax=Methylocapsa sp. S129 TaxID=1641869 RepID=UPI00131C6A02|nr:histidine--tRNA ligase [Methylocapsa sp. S129]
MSDEKTLPLVRPALPRGLIDRGPADIAAAEAMMAKIRAVYELYGFEAVETPFIEYTEALGKFLPDLDRPNEGVFSFKDDDEQWLSLRYDLTAPLARYVAEHFEKLPKPYRSYRAGWVFRNEKPGPGRFRQFMQFDADTVGAGSVAADAEICMMAADCMEALGIKRGDYVIKVNNRKVLDGLMEAIGLGGDENVGRRLTVLRAVDKLDRLGRDGVRALLGNGRRDESGDFTKGAGLEDEVVYKVLSYLDTRMHSGSVNASAEARRRGEVPTYSQIPGEETFPDERASFGAWRNDVGDSSIGQEGIDELEAIAKLCRAADYGPGRIIFESSVVRGLEYYTGPVFEAELTFEVKDDAGRPVRFGSVGGGGRYDGLVARFRGEPVPATGFSIGVSRLLSALRAIDSPIVAAAKKPGPVIVVVLDRDHMADYQRLVAQLRAAEIASELYLGSSGLNAQLKYADKRGSHCAIIQGSNERDHANGRQVVIRDLVLGAELAKASKDRADYLELRQRAQALAPEAELVARVREVLARHQV